ncbi:hypothetical protein Tco_0374385 [Tanacetum coccineum]
MICWKKILTAKKKGGLGVSSFFALNRALLFKWIWRFISHGTSLWSRFIKVIYGDGDAPDNPSILSRRSPWTDIIREFDTLSRKGIDIHSHVKKEAGNGEHTSFWDDVWLTESPLKHIYPRLFALECDKHASVAGKFRDPSLIASFRRAPRGDIEE